MSMFRNLLMASGYEPGLPKEYQEVEYIQSSGTQYIDTGIIKSDGVYVEGVIKYNTIGFYHCLMGEQNTPNVSSGGCQAPIICYGNRYIYAMYVGTSDYNTGLSINTQAPQTIKSSTIDGNTFLEVDGVRYTTTGPDTKTRGKKSIYIFAINNGGSAAFNCSARVYNLKIYSDVNGTKLRDYIPCYRKADNVIGLYDTVQNEFKTNMGTGTFEKGADV